MLRGQLQLRECQSLKDLFLLTRLSPPLSLAKYPKPEVFSCLIFMPYIPVLIQNLLNTDLVRCYWTSRAERWIWSLYADRKRVTCKDNT